MQTNLLIAFERNSLIKRPHLVVHFPTHLPVKSDQHSRENLETFVGKSKKVNSSPNSESEFFKLDQKACCWVSVPHNS